MSQEKPEFATAIKDLPKQPVKENQESSSSGVNEIKFKPILILIVLFWVSQFPDYTNMVFQLPILQNFIQFKPIVIAIILTLIYFISTRNI